MSSSDNKELLSSSDLGSASILTAFEVAKLAYDTYDPTTNLLMKNGVEDGIEKTLIADGWAPVDVDGENDGTSFQGDAFYKKANGVTEVIVGDRGSQSPHDFLVSDFEIASNAIPSADSDAVTYFDNVFNAVKKLVSGPVQFITTGHSLGGQEADYVNVISSDSINDIETVSFNAPGIATEVATGGKVYDALNISVSGDLVHSGGSLLNAGYQGQSVTVDAGTSLLPYFAVGVIGTLLTDSGSLAISGLGMLLYNGLYVDHITDVLADYFLEHPALGGINLQTYSPDQVQQDTVAELADLTPSAYAAMTDADKTNLYNLLLKGSVNGTTSQSGETFTASTVGNVTTLTGSDGDVETINSSTSTVTVAGSDGESLVFQFSSDGSQLQSESWTSDDGSSGVSTLISDGSSSTTVKFASGGYAKEVDDGQGNISIDYYTKSGALSGYSWEHSDGTSGSEEVIANGLTNDPASLSTRSVPSAGYLTLLNPDGSYATTSYDVNDKSTTVSYDDSGVAGTPVTVSGSGQNYDFSAPASTQVTQIDASDSITRYYNSAGTEISNSWIKSDGSHGTDTLNESGTITGTTVRSDSTSETYVLHQSVSGTSTTFAASSMTSDDVSGPYDLTRDEFDADGLITSDQWQLSDGASGQDSFSTDGSGTGTFHHADGTISTVTISSSHSVTVDNLDSTGALISEDQGNADGSYAVKLYEDGKLSETYSYAKGQVVVTDYAQDGSISEQNTLPAGEVMRPDGTDFGVITNAAGGYSLNYTDSDGDTLVVNVGANGAVAGTDHVSATTNPVDFGSTTLSNGQVAQVTYNDSTASYTSSDGKQYILYSDGSGKETGDDWTKSDGSHGYDTFGANNSSSGSIYTASGSYTTYTNDGQGNISDSFYDSSGNLTGDAWQGSDGSYGSDTVNADGSSSGIWYNKDQSYLTYANDGQGDVAEIYHDSAGMKTGDAWADTDGSHGSETIAANGERTGTSYDAEGNYASYDLLANGSGKTTDYTSGGVETQQTQTVADGTGNSVSYTFDPTGNAIGTSWTSASGASYSAQLSGGAGLQSSLTSSTASAASISTGSGGGIVAAWGDHDTVTAGGGTVVVDAFGSYADVIGGSGNDTLAALGAHSTLVAGTGSMVFEINDATDVIQGVSAGSSDSVVSAVTYTLPTNLDVLTLAGSANLSATGNNDATNVITGNSGNDTLTAGSGNDTLISGTGVDLLYGGRGTDTFYVNNSSDTISVPYGYGDDDTVYASVNYVLNAAIGSLTLTGSTNLAATDQYGYAALTGNSGNDTLTGGSGVDTLIGGSGIDTFVTGTGNNTIVLNNASDVIQVSTNHGVDTVESSVSYTLTSGIDTLMLTGSDNLVGTGNADATNYIAGNSGNDTLIAGSGSDTLVAGSGVDTLVAGSGSDVLQGNAGDTYELDAGFGQEALETSSGAATVQFGTGITASALTVGVTTGSDGQAALLIQDGTGSATIGDGLTGSVSGFKFADGSQVSLGQLLATAQMGTTSISGSAGDVFLTNTASATLTGGLGDDTLIGAGNGDVLLSGSGNQTLYGYGSGDVLTGSVGDDTLYGSGGNDVMIAGTGHTEMYGGSSGSDTFRLTAGGTATIHAGSSSGVEAIYLPSGMSASDFNSYQDQSGDLVMQSKDGSTTAIIKGYYDSTTTQKLWLLMDGDGTPQSLASWAASPSASGTSYQTEIDQMRSAFAVELTSTLNDIGQNAGSPDDLGDSNSFWTSSGNTYEFTGLTTTNLKVQDGVLDLGDSVTLSRTYTATTEQITQTYQIPIYQTITTPEQTYYLPLSSSSGSYDTSGNIYGYSLYGLNPVYDASGNEVGLNITTPAQTVTEQTGTRTVTRTVTVPAYAEHVAQGFTDYNITGDGGNDVITADPLFLGTVVTGDGNVSLDLGGSGGGANYQEPGSGQSFYEQMPWDVQGAFIELGNGNDVVFGTGGRDVIAAGTGFDQISGDMGTTYYAPMSGDSTTVIGDPAMPYGGGPFPLNKFVLPDGVALSDLTLRTFVDPVTGGSVLELRHGNSTVLLDYSTATAPNAWNVDDGQPAGYHVEPGVNVIQLADGTEYSIQQLIAMATPASDLDPIAQAHDQTLTAGETVSAATFFSGTDNADNPITWYQVTNTGTGGGYFVLNGKVQAPGTSFYVSESQLSGLQYVAGSASSEDSVQVSAFDGAIWSSAASFSISSHAATNGGGTYQASGTDQTVTGATTGPDTITGGYDGDTLVGQSGQDTFVFNSGSGSETITESKSASAGGDNTLSFGAGISADQITLSVTTGPQLVMTIGASGDSVSIENFDPVNPLSSLGVQHFEFTNGSSFSFGQLLTLVRASSGSYGNADGSTTYYSFNPLGDQLYSAAVINPDWVAVQAFSIDSDGSTDKQTRNADGTFSETITQTDAQGGVTTVASVFDSQYRLLSQQWTGPDGSTDQATLTYNANGTYERTDITTPAGGGGATTVSRDFDSQNRVVTEDWTYADGSTDDGTLSYASDGSYARTDVSTAVDGSKTTVGRQFDTSGRLIQEDWIYSDGSTDNATLSYASDGSWTRTDVTASVSSTAATTVVNEFNAQGQLIAENWSYPDGSTSDSTRTYAAVGSCLRIDVNTPANGGAATTTSYQLDPNGQVLNESVYTPAAGGSYSDDWQRNTDGSSGSYWWNAATREYQESWQDAGGTTWTDTYQYAAGGSPGSSNVSFTETFASSDGSHGTRVFDASTGNTYVTWYTSAGEEITGAVNDHGFVGISGNNELTNTQADLTFFNPNASSSFQNFLATH